MQNNTPTPYSPEPIFGPKEPWYSPKKALPIIVIASIIINVVPSAASWAGLVEISTLLRQALPWLNLAVVGGFLVTYMIQLSQSKDTEVKRRR